MKQIPKEFNVHELTFYTEAPIKAGMTVEIDSDGNLNIAPDNYRFAGICTKIKDNYATVTFTGIVTVHYTGDAPSKGYNLLTSDGAGNVKFDFSSDFDYLILDVNEEDQTVTFML